MTKMEMFEAIKNAVADNAEMVEFLDKEMEMLAKRNSHRSDKPTKAQLERKAQYDTLIEWLADNENATCAQVAEFMGVTLHSATGLLTQLRKAGQVKRDYAGKTPVYSLGCEG